MTGGLERFFVYFPTREITVTPAAAGLSFKDLTITTDDNVRLNGWYVPNPAARWTVVVFHGNAGNISHRVEWIQLLHSLPASVLIVDYRGYGKSEGRPHEQGLYRDAQATYRWWSENRKSANGRIALIGESLGGAVAVDLASRVPVDALVLQSTFSSAWDMAKTLFPIGLLQPLAGVHFDSVAKIRTIRCPKLIIHGDRDDIVPFRLGRKLFEAAAPPKEFYTVTGAAHNDLIWAAGNGYILKLRDFMK